MSREILFRGKDKDDGNWYEGYYLQLHDTTYCCMPSDNADEANRLNEENEHHYIVFEQMTDWGLPNKHLRAEVDPKTVCQYTGLTDKNGRKIFEGDIIKHFNRPSDDESYVLGYIKWNQNKSRFVKENTDGAQYCINNECVYEVIDNIFDNPDLCKM